MGYNLRTILRIKMIKVKASECLKIILSIGNPYSFRFELKWCCCWTILFKNQNV